MEDVIITVSDGVPNVAQVPAGVRVIIRDFDVLEETEHKDEDGDFYTENIWMLEDGEVVLA